MPILDDYKVELEIFEGPLDLLLYLIKRDEIDIYDIPIERITNQYMEYMDVMKMLDLNIAGEFLVMAATLMLIKSRTLLPVEDRPEQEEEEEDDPRWELVRQLVEYKKFKDVAARFQEREILQEDVFMLGADGVTLEPEDPGVVLQDVSLFDLLSAFNNVLKRLKPEQIGEIYAHVYTVADKIAHVLSELTERDEIVFEELFGEQANRHEVICTFLAVLELIRLRQVGVRQDATFGEIRVFRRREEEVAAGGAVEAAGQGAAVVANAAGRTGEA